MYTNALRVFVRILWPCFGQAMMTCSHDNALHEVLSTAYNKTTSASTWGSVHAAYVNETL